MKAYSDGYETGYRDGKLGKRKNYSGMGRGIISIDFNHYASQYKAGYDDAYRQALKDQRRTIN